MIHYHTRPLFEENTQHDDNVIELGDQIINYNEVEKDIRSLDFYPGINITSIDNRKDADRAHNVDLSKNISTKSFKEWGEFDVLTDFGTIEHVKSLYYALKNSFAFVKTGGLFIHCNPKQGHFPAHNDYHKFSQGFWKAYAKLSRLELVKTGEHAAYHNTKTGMEVYAILRKSKEAKFPVKKDFDTIYKKWITKN